jgi:hypothetical protein
MNRLHTHLIVLLAAMCLAVGCEGPHLPSDRTVFDIAVQAAGTQALLPPGATVLPMEESVFSIGKNAGRIDLAYETADGRKAGYSICLKRVARTWTFERAYPTPTYPPPGQ